MECQRSSVIGDMFGHLKVMLNMYEILGRKLSTYISTLEVRNI